MILVLPWLKTLLLQAETFFSSANLYSTPSFLPPYSHLFLLREAASKLAIIQIIYTWFAPNIIIGTGSFTMKYTAGQSFISEVKQG